MSSPRRRLDFARRAQQDLDDILQWSLQVWGVEQQDRYAAALERGIALLLEQPNAGRAREDLGPGFRVYPVAQHLIFYRVTGRNVRAVRILHHRQTTRRAFD